MLKSLKKITTLLVAAACIATTVVPVASATELPASEFKAANIEFKHAAMDYAHPFADVNPRYEEAVSVLYAAEITNGKSPTEFGTYDNLTRGDAAVILARTLELDTQNVPDSGFTDLNTRVKGAVNALVAQELFRGLQKMIIDLSLSSY